MTPRPLPGRRALLLAAPALLLARPDAAAALDCDARERGYFGNSALTDQHGRTVRLYDDVLRGQSVLIGWIFTSCPDACPLLASRSLAIADTALQAAPDAPPPRIVHLTTDPRRDSPAKLRAWAAKFGDYRNWVLLTGAPGDLRQVAQRLGQAVDEARPDRHTTLLLAGNVAARRWNKLRPDLSAEAAGLQLAELARASAVADAAACPA